MARSRFIKPEFYDDPVLARCSHGARLLFPALWQLADRSGVFEWDVAKLRKYVFGYEDITQAQVSSMLDELVAGGFVRWANVEGRQYGFVVNLAKHQKFHVAEKPKYDDVHKQAKWVSAPTQHPASTLLAPTPHNTDTVPESLSLETETETETDTDLSRSAVAETRAPQKRERSPEEKARAKLVKDAWFTGHRKRYGRDPDQWGAPESAHVYHLLKSSSADTLAAKALAYHAWGNPKVIEAGHPFMGHPKSFSATLSELTADMVDPHRRALAAQLNKRQQLSNEAAEQDDQTARVLARMEAKHGPARIERAGSDAPRDSQPQALRPGARDVAGGAAGVQPGDRGVGDPGSLQGADVPGPGLGGGGGNGRAPP